MQNLLVISIFFVLLMQISLQAQQSDNNTLILNKNTTQTIYEESQPKYLFHNKSFLVKYNPVSIVMGGLMYFYQACISPQLGSNCMFRPSCSNFSIALIKEYGIIKGACLSADRLMRCNRIASSDLSASDFNPETQKIHESVNIYSMKYYKQQQSLLKNQKK